MKRERNFALAAVVFILTLGLLDASCEFTKNITVTTKVRSLSDGFHPTLRFDVRIGSMQRFLDCSVIYKLTIPNGAYLDLYSLRENRPELHLYTDAEFNVEAPAHQSKAERVFLCSRQTLVNSFVFSETLILPVHLRYHKPITSNSKGNSPSATVRFPHPEVLLRCVYDEIPKKCDPYMQQATCDCSTQHDLCSYLSVSSNSGKMFELPVPVGDPGHFFVVFTITVVVVIAVLGYVACARAPSAYHFGSQRGKSE